MKNKPGLARDLVVLHAANSFKGGDLPGVWYWSLFNIYLTDRTDYNIYGEEEQRVCILNPHEHLDLS